MGKRSILQRDAAPTPRPAKRRRAEQEGNGQRRASPLHPAPPQKRDSGKQRSGAGKGTQQGGSSADQGGKGKGALQGQWFCASVVDRQAASAVGKLLQSDATRRKGVSVKALTLAPSIQAKAATHAVTCETLKRACRPLQGGGAAGVGRLVGMLCLTHREARTRESHLAHLAHAAHAAHVAHAAHLC